MKVSAYSKTIVAIIMAAGTALTAAITDDWVTTTEWVQVILAVLGAAGVYVIPNTGNPHDRPSPPELLGQ